MRLTLRTLLASLDHVLPPEQQAELDTKTAASTAAMQLTTRIRRVLEQPTIPAPRLDGRGLGADANSVAEYLDNCLDHDRLESFERICLESDMHLAEVAACHDILAALAHDPAAAAPLDAAGRHKLLQAMDHHSALVAAASERREAELNAEAIRSVVRRDPVTSSRRSSRAAWAAALAAMALLLTLCVFLVGVIGRRGGRAGHEVAPQVALDADRAPVAEPVTPPATEPDHALAVEAASTPPPASSPPMVAKESSPALPAPTPEPEAEPAKEIAVERSPAMAGEAARVPQGDALAIAAPDIFPPAVAAQQPERSSPAVTAALGFVGPGGLLLHRMAGDDGPRWAAMVAGATLGEREDLMVPPGSHPDINVRGVTIRLMPDSRVVVAADSSGVPRLEVVFGRAIVRASRPESRIAIAAGGLVGTITAGLVHPAAVSVELERASGSDPLVDQARARASVVAVGGPLGWRQGGIDGVTAPAALSGIAAEGVIDAHGSLVWESVSPGAARVARLEQLPEWMTSQPVDKLQRNASAALAARVLETSSLDQALHELAADTRVENRVLAASTLALVGEFDEAVELLCSETPGRRLEQGQWTRLEADVVPLALARGANAAAKLRRAFEDRGPHGKAETLYAMARGFNDAELAAGGAEALVTALEDGDLVVRRYAYKCLCDIVQPSRADQLHYRPDGLADRRREGVNWWRGQLQKGLIRRRGAA